MQELTRILIAVNSSQDLNKENIADKIKAKIEAKLEENLDEQTKEDLEKCLKRWKKDNFNLSKFPYGNLLQLAAEFNCEKLAKHLVASGFDVNDGFPLHCAAKNDHTQIVKILLAAKADVNIQDESGLTALHYAVYSGDREIEMVKSLLKAGATNVQIKCGFTPVMCGFTPLHHAAQYGYVQAVETLLKEGGADVNVQDKNGKTPLHRAAQHGHIQVVEILLKEGARVDLQNKNGKTPLHHAAKRGYTQIVEALLRKEASINVQDKHGKTPLYSAIRYGYTQVADVLLKGGAGVNVQDKEGTTPLDWAYSCNPKVAKLLLDYGADPSCIHRPKAITAGVAVGVISAVVVPLVLAYATALPALAIIGITVVSALVVGGIAYGIAYKASEHSLSSKLSEISCSNIDACKQTVNP